MIKTIKLNELKDEFLLKGGTLLKKDTNKQGEPVILHKKAGIPWRTRLTFTREEFRDRTFEHLTRKHKTIFKAANEND
jgi:hypothetical protein